MVSLNGPQLPQFLIINGAQNIELIIRLLSGLVLLLMGPGQLTFKPSKANREKINRIFYLVGGCDADAEN